MTVDEVKAWVQTIHDNRHDDEKAHSDEDALHRAVLDAIANGAPNARLQAREALETRNISFARWCA